MSGEKLAIVTADVRLEGGKYGPRAVLTGPYSDDVLKYLKGHGVRELELNSGKGWRGSTLNFVCEVPELLSLVIRDFTLERDDAIHCLHRLRELHLSTYCLTELRFGEFPVLEVCALEWRPKATSLFGCRGLKDLFVNRYKGEAEDLAQFAQLQKLERLGLLNVPVRRLAGIEKLKKLRFLRLGNLKRLRGLRGLEAFTHLEELQMSSCSTGGSIKEVGALGELRRLILVDCGKIASLEPLLALPKLEEVMFPGTTNVVDGNLSILTDLPRLRKVAFKNRQHYSHTMEQFAALAG